MSTLIHPFIAVIDREDDASEQQLKLSIVAKAKAHVAGRTAHRNADAETSHGWARGAVRRSGTMKPRTAKTWLP